MRSRRVRAFVGGLGIGVILALTLGLIDPGTTESQLQPSPSPTSSASAASTPIREQPTPTQHATRSRPASGYHRLEPHGPNWRALAQCESSNNPRAISPDGLYHGLYQFDLQTWHSVGGHGDPAAAPATEQHLRARALYATRGRQPWPICGRHL